MPHPAITKSIEVYNFRNADDTLRDLERHEETFLREVHRIDMLRATTIGEAVKLWGDGSRAYEATVFLADRQHDRDLTRALDAYNEATDADDEVLEIEMLEAAE